MSLLAANSAEGPNLLRDGYVFTFYFFIPFTPGGVGYQWRLYLVCFALLFFPMRLFSLCLFSSSSSSSVDTRAWRVYFYDPCLLFRFTFLFGGERGLRASTVVLIFIPVCFLFLRRRGRVWSRESDERETVDNDTIYGYHTIYTYFRVVVAAAAAWLLEMFSCVCSTEKDTYFMHTQAPKNNFERSKRLLLLLLLSRASERARCLSVCLFVKRSLVKCHQPNCHTISTIPYQHASMREKNKRKTIKIFTFFFSSFASAPREIKYMWEPKGRG